MYSVINKLYDTDMDNGYIGAAIAENAVTAAWLYIMK